MLEIFDTFHMAHVVGDLAAVEQWYRDTFGAWRFYGDYSPEAQRDGSFLMIGDTLWELLTTGPHEGDELGPIGRFRAKQGDRFYSFAWYVNSIQECFDRLDGAGIEVLDVTGAPIPSGATIPSADAIFTHPRSTFGVLQFVEVGGVRPEYMPPESAPDPRHWSEDHPLGIRGISHVTFVADDFERARRLFCDTLGGEEFLSRSTADGAQSCFIALGTCDVVEVRSATRAFPKLGAYTLTFLVHRVQGAIEHLEACGMTPVVTDDGTVASLSEADGRGVPYSFSDHALPNDPRALQS